MSPFSWFLVTVVWMVVVFLCLKSGKEIRSIRPSGRNDGEWKIIVVFSPSMLDFLLGSNSQEMTFVGQNMEWYLLPTREPCRTKFCFWLYKNWKQVVEAQATTR